MEFKDQIKSDLAEVFFNQDEFAEEATYNGEPVEIIPDEAMLQSAGTPGVIVTSLTLYVQADQVAVCKQGDRITHGGHVYHVVGIPSLDAGLWTLQVDRETKNLNYGV